MQYGQQIGVKSYKVVIRYLDTLTMDMWFDYSGRKLEIASIDEYEARLFQVVTCTERLVPQ